MKSSSWLGREDLVSIDEPSEKSSLELEVPDWLVRIRVGHVIWDGVFGGN